MNKELLTNLQLQAGGSHYPSINPQMQEIFARLIIEECVDAIKKTNKTHAYTTYDLDLVEATIQRSIASINEKFGFENEYYVPRQSHQNVTSE